MRKVVFLLVVVLMAFSSCKILAPSIMMQTGKEYQFDQLSDSLVKQYKLSPNDRVTFRLFANDGFKMMNVGLGDGDQQMNQNLMRNNNIEYNIEFDGKIKLPVLGRVEIAGRTLREAENYLQELYAQYFINPFVQLNVTNRRVIVFPGEAGLAQVVLLENDNITLMEALALVGGLSQNGKAYNVKLIRQFTGGKNQVYQFDLSTIEGLKFANTVLQANDIIYVEPRRMYASRLAQEVAPYLQVVTTFTLVITLIRSF